MKTLFGYFDEACARFPRNIAVVDGDERCTYEQLARSVRQLAGRFMQLGIGRGSRVALLFPNSLDFVEVVYALFLLKAVPAPLNWRMSGEELLRQIEVAESDYVVYHRQFADQLGELEKELSPRVLLAGDAVIGREGAQEYSFEDDCDGDSGCLEGELAANADDDGLILFTSGSTGAPKAVVMTQRALSEKIGTFLAGEGAYDEHDSFLLFNPLFHQGGLSFLMFLLSVGAKVVLQKSLRAEYVMGVIGEEGVTQMLLLPPSLCRRIRECPLGHDAVFPTVRCVTLTGGKDSVDIVRDIFGLFPSAKIRNGYGHTENAVSISHLFTRDEFEADERIALSVGKPEPGYDIRLLDQDGNEVDAGVDGMVWGKSPAMFDRYLGEGQATVDGYFSTGDVMRRDEVGNYYFIGRSKEMIKSGGENVFPAEVERVLESHPGIAEAAVFGVEHRDLGECVAAAVVANETFTEVDSAALADFCKHQIASYKKPRMVMVVEALPRLATGKIDRAALARLAASGRVKRWWCMD